MCYGIWESKFNFDVFLKFHFLFHMPGSMDFLADSDILCFELPCSIKYKSLQAAIPRTSYIMGIDFVRIIWFRYPRYSTEYRFRWVPFYSILSQFPWVSFSTSFACSDTLPIPLGIDFDVFRLFRYSPYSSGYRFQHLPLIPILSLLLRVSLSMGFLLFDTLASASGRDYEGFGAGSLVLGIAFDVFRPFRYPLRFPGYRFQHLLPVPIPSPASAIPAGLSYIMDIHVLIPCTSARSLNLKLKKKYYVRVLTHIAATDRN